MRFAEGRVSGANARNRRGRGAVEQLIKSDCVIATCEVALIEFHDSVGRRVRDVAVPHFDEAWFEQATSELMALVASKRVEVVPVPPKAVENAMALMTIAHRDEGIAFHAWDAIHLIVALAWGVALGSKVELATCDTDFPRFIEAFPHFKPYVSVLMVA
jgi:hypothetical protein